MGQVRKGRRRARKETPIDENLSILASVLAEYQLDNNAYGWFRPPWRNGQNAARLAMDAAALVDKLSPANTVPWWSAEPYTNEVTDLIEEQPLGEQTYEKAGEIFKAILSSRTNTPAGLLLAAAMRCLQLRIARSDGGGAVYNELLIPVFLPIEPARVEKLVLEHRCIDSIGVSRHLVGDRNDRQRSAFVIAWQRGLYLAAYSLPPAF